MSVFFKAVKSAAVALGFLLSTHAPLSAQDAPKAKITLGTLKVASQTPVWIAQQQGIFAKHGIQAELVYFNNGAAAVSGLQAGAADVVLCILGSGLMAVSRGFNIVPVFQDEISQAQGPDTSGIHVLKSSGIATLKDLEGKKFAIGGLATQNTVAVRAVLKKAGVDVSKVQFTEMPFPTMLAALQNGLVDAVNAVDPFTTQIRTAEGVETLAYNYVETAPEQPLGVWFAGTDYLKNNADVVTSFTQALREAIDYMNADPKRARAHVAEFTNIAPEVLADMPLTNWSFEVQPEKWQAVIDMMHAEGLLPEARKADSYFSDQLRTFVKK